MRRKNIKENKGWKKKECEENWGIMKILRVIEDLRDLRDGWELKYVWELKWGFERVWGFEIGNV